MLEKVQGSCKRNTCSLVVECVGCNFAVSFETRVAVCLLEYLILWTRCPSTDTQLSPWLFMALTGYCKTSSEILSILIIKITRGFFSVFFSCPQCAFCKSFCSSILWELWSGRILRLLKIKDGYCMIHFLGSSWIRLIHSPDLEISCISR